MRRKARAMSIIEMLIACGVMGILLAMIADLVAPTITITTEGTMRVDLQEQGMIATNKMVYALQQTSPTGVSLSVPASPGGPMMAATNPLAGVDSFGYPLYQSQVQVFWTNTATKEIWTKSWPVSPPDPPYNFTTSTPNVVTPAQLSTIVNTTNGTERRLVQYVNAFTIQQEPTSGGSVFAIRMDMQETVPNSNKLIDVGFCRKLVLRNNGD